MNLSYTIPESLDEIKLKDYIQIHNLLNNASDEHDLVIKIRMASIVTGLSLEDIVKIPSHEISEIFNNIVSILNEKPKLKPIIKVNGIEYGFIPDIDNLMTNEHLDLGLYFGFDMLKTTAILYRPVRSKVKRLYTIEQYKGVKDTDPYLDFPASAYVSCSLFFYSLMRDLLKITPQFLQEKMEGMPETTLQKSGDGISQLMSYLEEIDLNMIKL